VTHQKPLNVYRQSHSAAHTAAPLSHHSSPNPLCTAPQGPSSLLRRLQQPRHILPLTQDRPFRQQLPQPLRRRRQRGGALGLEGQQQARAVGLVGDLWVVWWWCHVGWCWFHCGWWFGCDHNGCGLGWGWMDGCVRGGAAKPIYLLLVPLHLSSASPADTSQPAKQPPGYPPPTSHGVGSNSHLTPPLGCQRVQEGGHRCFIVHAEAKHPVDMGGV